MNKYVIQGFQDGLVKRANLGSLAKYLAGYTLGGASMEAGSEYLREDDPNYKRAILIGAIKGALAGAAHYGLRREMHQVSQDAMGETLRDFAFGLTSAG